MTNWHALRSLKRAPVFAVAMILTLAIGIGAVASMFAIVYGVLLAPLPYREPERLVAVGLQAAEQRRISQAPGLYFTYERFARGLDGVGLYRTGSTNVRTTTDDADASSVTATWVTASVMPLLQITPLLGRSFTPEEELRGGPNAVILSEAEWRNRFGAASDVIGKTLIVNDAAREIVGVMPARFSFPTAATRLWLPVKHTDSPTMGDFFYAGVARLAPGATAEQAQSELATLLPRAAELFPQLQSGGSTATWLDEVRPTPLVLPLRDELTGSIAGWLWMLATAAVMVLLVAWANVANLMLVRADASQSELAVRETLGAGRLRVATHFLGESILLAATAAVLALLVTYASVKALAVFGPSDFPRLAELEVGFTTAAFIALVASVGVVICIAVPTLRLQRGSLARIINDGARGLSMGKSRQGLLSTVSVLQIALALVVSAGSALLLRTAHNLYQVHPGFDANEVTTLRILLPFARYRDATTVAFYAQLMEQVGQLPSVLAAGLTTKLPLGGGGIPHQNFQLDAADTAQSLPVNVISNGYFSAMRIPLLAGRDFRPLEQDQATDIIISQRAAAKFFGDSDGATAVGKWLTLAPNGPTYTVIGIVGDVHDQDLATAPSAMMYRPQLVPTDPSMEPGPKASLVLAVRSSDPSEAVISEIRQIVRSLDPTVPIFEVRSMNEVLSASTSRLSLALTLLTAAAAITLLLGGIGLYGVMAYMVALRTREFGVRVAVGADPKRIAGLVIARGLALTACGVAIGLTMYAIAAPALQAFLYAVTITDAVALTAATLVVTATALAASWLPAQRAARVDPANALRA